MPRMGINIKEYSQRLVVAGQADKKPLSLRPTSEVRSQGKPRLPVREPNTYVPRVTAYEAEISMGTSACAENTTIPQAGWRLSGDEPKKQEPQEDPVTRPRHCCASHRGSMGRFAQRVF